ncbi:hypothetical protein ABTX77_13810 [Streptomyces sp. NPDC097704]|uniref:hypothetical protein n=1 Tax=Streptomyces sp. NPDC097704 TaxID=3157101 RepID=UPI003329C254
MAGAAEVAGAAGADWVGDGVVVAVLQSAPGARRERRTGGRRCTGVSGVPTGVPGPAGEPGPGTFWGRPGRGASGAASSGATVGVAPAEAVGPGAPVGFAAPAGARRRGGCTGRAETSGERRAGAGRTGPEGVAPAAGVAPCGVPTASRREGAAERTGAVAAAR